MTLSGGSLPLEQERLPASEDSPEPVSEPGGHRVVEDGVDCGVDVEHEAAEVEDVEVKLGVDVVEYLVGRDDDPHGEDLEGEEAGEEEEDDRAEHHHDLPPAPGDGGRLPRALLDRGGRVRAP